MRKIPPVLFGSFSHLRKNMIGPKRKARIGFMQETQGIIKPGRGGSAMIQPPARDPMGVIGCNRASGSITTDPKQSKEETP